MGVALTRRGAQPGQGREERGQGGTRTWPPVKSVAAMPAAVSVAARSTASSGVASACTEETAPGSSRDYTHAHHDMHMDVDVDNTQTHTQHDMHTHMDMDNGPTKHHRGRVRREMGRGVAGERCTGGQR